MLLDEQSTDAPGAKTLAEALMRQIRSDIVRGELRPGDRLGMRALQDRYDVGMTPLREALSRLAALSLVTADGQRGFRVAEASEADLIDLVKTMVWAECTALRASISLGDREWEANIVAAAHRLDIDGRRGAGRLFDDKWEHDHRDFHRCLVAACAAPRLLSFRALLFEGMERYRRLSIVYGEGHRDADGEHRALVDSVLRRDAEAATRLLRAHLLETARILLQSQIGSEAVVELKIQNLTAEIEAGERTAF